MSDLIIPIVFPDYKVTIETPSVRFKVPDLIPFVDILPNNITVAHTENKLDNLGHAGILFIQGKTGVTKYYEYGRYDPQNRGWVKKIYNLPNVKMTAGDQIEPQSLSTVLGVISRKAGLSGRISGAYIEVPNRFEQILEFAIYRVSQNKIPHRKPYDVFSYSCVHFMQGALEAAGLDTPWLIDPRPVSYIEEIQKDYPPLEYDPKTNKYIIGKFQNVVGR
ncbi:hypothetical protein [Vibrio sp. SCSIO 43136]|uniref:hypothetical protein n=1 Tax=Vibrio sp. SCSIO 43136 TaxID=2819101 RepID=UPI002075F3E5|nr:hypothetical protein [Vibrio sp. SCSIO 43136]USD66043.1 hypothetical protein J4N39_04255 [Vibrio sp. SCSIO 43136]